MSIGKFPCSLLIVLPFTYLLSVSANGSEQSSIFQDVREGYNQAQHGVVRSVVEEVPDFTSDLGGCVGDFGIDVSINPSNWLSSIMDNLNSLTSFCENDFGLDDVDMLGGDDEYEEEDYAQDDPFLISVLPDSGMFTRKAYEYISRYWEQDHFYPKEAVEASNDTIMSVAMSQVASDGLVTLTASLNQLKRTFDAFDCDQFVYYRTDRDGEQVPVYYDVARCERIRTYFSERRTYLLSLAETAVSQYGALQ